jgi:hypothetical protein
MVFEIPLNFFIFKPTANGQELKGDFYTLDKMKIMYIILLTKQLVRED